MLDLGSPTTRLRQSTRKKMPKPPKTPKIASHKLETLSSPNRRMPFWGVSGVWGVFAPGSPITVRGVAKWKKIEMTVSVVAGGETPKTP